MNSPSLVTLLFFFSSRRRHTRLQGDWSSDVCSSDLVVVIADRYAHAEQTLSPDASLLGDIRKRAVTIVAIKRTPQGLGWLVKAGRCAVDKVKVHQAVLVVVNPAAAGAHRLNHVLFRRGGIVMPEGDAGRMGDV